MKELYCHKEWLVLEGSSSVQPGLFSSVPGSHSPSSLLPNCQLLPSLSADPDACTHVPFVGKILPKWENVKCVSRTILHWIRSTDISVKKKKKKKKRQVSVIKCDVQFHPLPFRCRANWASRHINTIQRPLILKVESVGFVRAVDYWVLFRQIRQITSKCTGSQLLNTVATLTVSIISCVESNLKSFGLLQNKTEITLY